jgi:hypothetical protein
VYKQRLSKTGAPLSAAERHDIDASQAAPLANGTAALTAGGCGSCYGANDAEHPCCDTCDQARPPGCPLARVVCVCVCVCVFVCLFVCVCVCVCV